MIADKGKELFFIPLIRHELGNRRRYAKGDRPSFWRPTNLLFYAIVIIAALLILYKDASDLSPLWNVCWVLPWIVFGVSIGVIRHESRQDTIGWWLSLPYSRLTLISSKFWAMLLCGIQIIGLILIAIICYATLALLFTHGSTIIGLIGFLKSGFVPVLLTLLALPLMASVGLTIGTVSLTRWRSAINKFWILWGLFWLFFGSMGFWKSLALLQNPLYLVLIIASSFIVAFLLLTFSAWMLKTKVDIG